LMKVADFGLARSILMLEKEQASKPVLTDYIATRWYRAPEILLGSTKYTKGVDMWAVGCILGELILERPLFPGTSTMNQLERIVAVVGFPSPSDIAACNSQFAETMLENLGKVVPKTLSDLCPKASPEAIDLMYQLLQFNPNKRLSADGALNHPYVAPFHNAKEEPAAPGPITISLPDDTRYTVAEYRDRLYQEILSKKRGEKKEKETTGFLPPATKPTSSSTLSRDTGNTSSAAKRDSLTGPPPRATASPHTRPVGSSSFAQRSTPSSNSFSGSRDPRDVRLPPSKGTL